MRLIIRLMLSAFAFTTVFPLIHGIDFHGNFVIAILISLVFGLMLWAVENLVTAISAIWTVTTFGLALLWLIPLWIVGFWVLPAFALILTADVMPQYLSISGFLPAAFAGFVLLLIGLATSKSFWRENRKAH